MSGPEKYAEAAPACASVDQFEGACVLDFGTNWCGHCQAAQPLIDAALAAHPGLRHLKIEDGKGRPLGRSFKVTLWPTLIFLQHGVEVARVVRPTDAQVVRDALLLIDPLV
ncbi:thioredoxin 1 [Actimicrobium sp. GrIS 1.19]|uniref:thioredoxin family protein n=1 Tax=Actimicrobium sp. GrIS 1.19 TaxID=3071708 RepID=UPI002E0627B2|nr:thioredoxin 1 [Actimicrobium sp. GrIS 1.19]